MEIVNVRYRNDWGELSARKYSYLLSPELKVKEGDFVKAPTAKGTNIAVICETNISPSRVDERILPNLKLIEERAEMEESYV